MEFHRVIKGKGNLVIKIWEHKMTDKLLTNQCRQTLHEVYSEELTESADAGLKAKGRQVWYASWCIEASIRYEESPLGKVVIVQVPLHNNGGMARVNSFVTKSSGTWG